MNNETMMNVDSPWGVCPYCLATDGYINIGRSHWFFCIEHKVRWCVGSNLFGNWREQTLEHQEDIYNELGFGSFRKIEEFHPEGQSIQ
jgi:hypothetical protein